jgi:hypothetical protein
MILLVGVDAPKEQPQRGIVEEPSMASTVAGFQAGDRIKRLTPFASIVSTRIRVASENRRVPLKIRSGFGDTPSV